MYSIEATRAFDDDLGRLDRRVVLFVLKKIEWIAEHPEVARHGFQYLPRDLHGLHKYRIGDYRLFFWMNNDQRVMTLYRIMHRRDAYKNL